MHVIEAKGILSPNNGMNLYRGCTHGCIYCDARSTCYNMQHEFTDIEIKGNALELLESALKRKRTKCMIGTGSMTDPYIHLENELKTVRRALELIERYGFGIAIQTKSTRILRDIDILKSINDKTKAVVQMTLTTYDESLCKIIEPAVSTTRERFEALLKFKEAGIPTVVWLTPLLPFINDTPENLRGILDYCASAGVRGIINFGMGLTLREGNREFFYENLDKYFPGVKEQYIRYFGMSYECASPRTRELMKIFQDFCKSNGIMHDNDEIFKCISTFESKNLGTQLSLFDM